MSEVKKCKRHGCNKEYSEETNTDDCCTYHPGWPLFHDLKKSWTCCKSDCWDWDQFMKLPGCTKGKHSDIKPERPTVNTSSAAQVNKPLGKDINEYNKQQAAVAAAAPLQVAATPVVKKQKPLLTASGKYKCSNVGCGAEFEPDENTETSCRHHTGKAIFHDTKKFWTCCDKSSYDWDDFMKIPPCATGTHNPKLVDA
eukprot:GDKI01043242.1.p1 GENE.GDKI01043242.1~~GDKI01043242.1.p1  ORF type:complete len:198 (-),score=52.08 GDKI01043242.1:27-620(-)